MPSDAIERMNRELLDRLRSAGTVEDRERLVIENLRRKEALIKGASCEVNPFKPKKSWEPENVH